MKVSGILETALYVAAPAASAAFYQRLFGFDTLLDTDRLVALNVAGRGVLRWSRRFSRSAPRSASCISYGGASTSPSWRSAWADGSTQPTSAVHWWR